jgi:hypothetical protein
MMLGVLCTYADNSTVSVVYKLHKYTGLPVWNSGIDGTMMAFAAKGQDTASDSTGLGLNLQSCTGSLMWM